jgi:hypothetical protein
VLLSPAGNTLRGGNVLKRAIAALSAAVVALSFAIVANDDLPTGRSTTNQALTAERTADLEAQVRALQSAKAALEAENAAERARIAELAAQVADLRAQLGAPANGCDVTVTSGLQAALDNSPEGATLCLSGTFTTSRPIQPKDGQTLVGPAKIVGQGMTVDGDVFSLKTQDTGSENVTLRDLDISGAGRHGVGCYIGTHIMGGRLHGNGKDGMGCDLDGRSDVGILVDGVEIDHNGTDPVWVLNAAGIKWFHLDGATVQNSHVHDNVGDGVWCDAQCGDFDVLDSVIERNTRKGVFYEKAVSPTAPSAPRPAPTPEPCASSATSSSTTTSTTCRRLTPASVSTPRRTCSWKATRSAEMSAR